MAQTNRNFWQLGQSYTSLPEGYYYLNRPEVIPSPKILYYNLGLAKQLGLSLTPDVEALAGQRLSDDVMPLSQAYAGHQFGNFTMLGDGRAHLLGEINGRDGQRYDIQLKGSGRTPYSRGGDGKAGLGPMLREYLMGEAMTALGIASTRGLAVIDTGQSIMREKSQQGAIFVRVAKSHLRVGTFQLAAARNDLVGLSKLAEYAIQRHYPAAQFEENPYSAFFQHVCENQGELIAKWQLVGFVHGVMNTDNVSIAGETMDYGPCAFLDAYSGRAVFSSIDQQGRYAYGNQPFIGGWNLARLAEALLPLLAKDEETSKSVAESLLGHYYKRHLLEWRKGFGYKLGFKTVTEADDELFSQLLSLMEAEQLDFTHTFIYLTERQAPHLLQQPPQPIESALLPWLPLWEARLLQDGCDKGSVYELMRQHNPRKIPRNHLVDQAIAKAETGDFDEYNRLLDALKHPYEQQDEVVYQPANPSVKPHKTYCGT